MIRTYQFWLSWIVQVLIAIGTIGAVVVALFGKWLRANLWPPELIVELRDDTEAKIPMNWKVDEASGKTPSRWCHVSVENKRRSTSPATDVQLFLLSVEETDASGAFTLRWAGEPVPLSWSFQKFKPATFTVGADRQADLFAVVKNPVDGPHWLQLNPLYMPFTLSVKWESGVKLALTVQARGIEGDSNKLRVEVSWDGQWSDDDTEMKRHLVIAATSIAA